MLIVSALAIRYLLAPQAIAENPPMPAPTPDLYGCVAPPSAVFTKLGVDISVASASYSKLVLGKIDVKTDPGVIDLVGKASREATVRDYLRCLAVARDKFTLEQASYTDRFNAFMATNPTPDQFIQWQKENPFPRTLVVTTPTVVACSRLSVTAEWQGVSSPEQKQSCEYSAPPNCTIISTSIQPHSDSNGSNAVSVAPDSRSLKATVTARPHGSFADRKRGWIDITVNASLRCEA